jgi:hypothetical protein
MTTAPGGVAVIATQLAQTDRRVLSEAWYSALHLAHGGRAPRARTATAAAPATVSLPAAAHMRVPIAETPPATTPVSRRGAREANVPVTPRDERRHPVTETARRVERAVERLACAPGAPAAHTIDVDGGRIRLLLHHDGRTTRIVALCSGPLREQVERALASARFALAGAGFATGAP